MSATLADLIGNVGEYTIDRSMESEDWQKAVAVDGLLATGMERYVDAAHDLVDRSIETQTNEGLLSYGSLTPDFWDDHDAAYQSQTDPAALGRAVLDFYRRTNEQRYLDAATRQYEYLDQRAKRTEDGGIAHHRGDVELWVDAIYMICPFLSSYGQVTDTPAAFDEATRQIEIQATHLQDSRVGLFRHEWREQPNMYPESTFWSRGNGWAAAGILDTLDYLPDDHPDRDTLVDIFQELAEAAIQHQDASGYWHNVIDDPQSPLETSGTLMFAYAFEKATQRGILDDDPYLHAAQRAIDVCAGVIDDDGAVNRVVGPPGGPGVPFAITSYGQGWFLKAASRFV